MSLTVTLGPTRNMAFGSGMCPNSPILLPETRERLKPGQRRLCAFWWTKGITTNQKLLGGKKKKALGDF